MTLFWVFVRGLGAGLLVYGAYLYGRGSARAEIVKLLRIAGANGRDGKNGELIDTIFQSAADYFDDDKRLKDALAERRALRAASRMKRR